MQSRISAAHMASTAGHTRLRRRRTPVDSGLAARDAVDGIERALTRAEQKADQRSPPKRLRSPRE